MTRKKMTIAALAGFVACSPGGDTHPYHPYGTTARTGLLTAVVNAGLVDHVIIIKKFNKGVVVRHTHLGYVIDVFPIMDANGRRRVAHMEDPT